MSEILYNINKLSKDICSIINKYLDFSLNNFKKKLNKTCIEKCLRIRSDITLNDILMKCVKNGFIGFFVNKKFQFNFQLDLLYNKSLDFVINNIDNKIIKVDGETHIKYCVFDDNERYLCDIMTFLEIFEIISL